MCGFTYGNTMVRCRVLNFFPLFLGFEMNCAEAVDDLYSKGINQWFAEKDGSEFANR